MEPRFNLFDSPTAAKVAKRFYNTSLAVEQSDTAQDPAELMQLRASQINGCGCCVDIHTKEAAAAGETPLRLNLVAAWRHTTVFTEAERAALALTEEGTRHRRRRPGRVRRDLGAVRKHYDDDQVGALVCLVVADQRGQPDERDRRTTRAAPTSPACSPRSSAASQPPDPGPAPAHPGRGRACACPAHATSTGGAAVPVYRHS